MYHKVLFSSRSVKVIAKSFLRRFQSTDSQLSSLCEFSKNGLVYSEREGYVMKSPYGPVSIPDMTIDQYVWKDVSKWQNHVAIECGITGRKYTYAKLRDHCAALAIRLRSSLMLESGDIVGICLPNIPEYAISFLGSVESALVCTTINPWYTSEEISRNLISCKPKAIFCLTDNYEVIKNACLLAQQAKIKVIGIKSKSSDLLSDGMINFEDLINPSGLNLNDSTKLAKNVKYDDLTVLPYSSGTTGVPKGVMLTHKNLVANCQSLVDVDMPYRRLVPQTTNENQYVLPCFLPFYHIYGLMGVLVPKLALGCKIVSIPKFEVNSFLRITKEHKATFLHLVPPTVHLLSNYEGAKSEHFTHVRQVMCGASNLSQNDVERFNKKLQKNTTIHQGYGLSETSPMATITPQGLQNFSTIGWPVPNVEMKIANLDDPNFKGLPPNETGEILIRGPNVMKGYYENHEATKLTITQGKWLRSGDIGHIDENGFFYISDRLKELIKVNANQVAPAELEGILRDHADILDAVVIGIPHPKCGEVPKAFVVRRPESKITEEDIQQFVAKQVIKYKQLTGGVQFIDSIPKTATGKILRREIRKIFS